MSTLMALISNALGGKRSAKDFMVSGKNKPKDPDYITVGNFRPIHKDELANYLK